MFNHSFVLTRMVVEIAVASSYQVATFVFTFENEKREKVKGDGLETARIRALEEFAWEIALLTLLNAALHFCLIKAKVVCYSITL